MKSSIYNLIILDESGSMEDVKKSTISGCNETVNTICAAQKKFAETQEHFVSIYAFQSKGSRSSRYLLKNVPADEVKRISKEDYEPDGCTPLYDAVGATLTDLKSITAENNHAIGSVTIITDGLENDSHRYSGEKIAQMINDLKEMGWNFNFIGSEIDVEEAAQQMNIGNTMSWEHTDLGASAMYEEQGYSRMRYYERVDGAHRASEGQSGEVRRRMMREAEESFFDKERETRRYTPYKIDYLEEGQVFVFGSNLQGMHGGGAARTAVQKFGAVMGQGVGLQGQSYAIPTMQGGVETIKPYVDDFIEFARDHQELTFLVTRIGCGIAGFQDREIAPLFKKAVNVKNIYLPESFWRFIR